MTIELKGMNELVKQLEKRFGKESTQRISDKALTDGAKIFVDAINKEIKSRPDKGYAKGWTVDDTSISEPTTIGGARTVKIHWNGPHGRYNLIHLNEFGTVKNPNPPRKGAIAKALRSAETAYRESIKKSVEGAM